MTRRFTISDSRWFTDFTPTCISDDILKQHLGAKNNRDYSLLLQEHAEEIMKNSFFAPQITISKDLETLKQQVVESVPSKHQ